MRAGLRDDLANLWLQVEVMALWAGTAVESACRVATSGDNAIAAAMIASDDEIDAMQMPPTSKCITELRDADAARVAVGALVVGRSLDRIGDHTTVIANRLRFMFTGDHVSLAAEVG